MRAVLEKGRAFRFEARGTSMLPLIRDGDVVTVTPLSGGGPRTGDVVAFADPGRGRRPYPQDRQGRRRGLSAEGRSTTWERTACSPARPSWAWSLGSSAAAGPSSRAGAPLAGHGPAVAVLPVHPALSPGPAGARPPGRERLT